MRIRRVATALPILSLAVPLVCQTIRVTVDLVQVDAVVTDDSGHHVANLKAEDFQILEDGKPQPITHFEYVQGSGLPSAATAMSVSSATRSVGAVPPVAPQLLRPEQVRRTIVLLADDLGLSFGDMPRVRAMLNKFIDSQMEPGDLVSVMTSSGGTGALDQFTSDKRVLHAAVERIHFLQGRNGLTWYDSIHMTQPGRQGAVAALTEMRVTGLMNQTSYSYGSSGALRYAIEGLRDLPGRKAVAVFSDGGIPNPGDLVEAANRASVVLYTFDARGIESFTLSASDSIYANSAAQNIGAVEQLRQRAFVTAQQSLELLARGTGGIFFHDNNGLSLGLAAALDDMGSYYLIGYQPHREDFEHPQGFVPYHKLEVKVLRAGLHVRSRQGFYGTPDSPSSTAPLSAPDQLRRALASPFAASGLPVHLSVFYAAGSDKAKPGHLPLRLRAMLLIDARALKFEELPDGKKKLRLDALAAAFGSDNQPVGLNDETFLADLSPEELERIQADGLVYSLNLNLPNPGPWQVRAAVSDRNSGLLGSASSFVEVPDLNQKRIALTSILLHDADAQRNAMLGAEGLVGAGSVVTRVFAQGAVLTWQCNVTGTLVDKTLARPKIEVEMRLYHGQERVFSGKPIPLAMQTASTASIYTTGTIKLPALLPPGNYALELVAYDRNQRAKFQQATQWTDFTLVKSVTPGATSPE